MSHLTELRLEMVGRVTGDSWQESIPRSMLADPFNFAPVPLRQLVDAAAERLTLNAQPTSGQTGNTNNATQVYSPC